jgi:DNA-binding FrmR family transcriptional regulator
VKIAAAMMSGTTRTRTRSTLQLRRIEGEVRGIQRMVEDEA